MQLHNRFWGSSTALWIGGLFVFTGVLMVSQGRPGSILEAGVGMVLGAMAYRSLKKRLLGQTVANATALVYEYACIAGVSFLLLAGIGPRGYYDPVPYAIIPLWALGVYFIARIRGRVALIN